MSIESVANAGVAPIILVVSFTNFIELVVHYALVVFDCYIEEIFILKVSIEFKTAPD